MKLLVFFLAAALAHGEVVHFGKVAEPKEGALTILIPSGWKISGGIVRVNLMAAGGPLNSIAAKLDLNIASADGRTLLHRFPEMNYADLRK